MNESGRSVGEAMRFYKLGLESIVVIHDELDLAPGKVRVKVGGGAAGHNGLRSITAHVGNDYKRVRLGIGHPGDKDLVYPTCSATSPSRRSGWVEAVCDAVARAAELLAQGQDASFQNKVHLALEAAGFAGKEAKEEALRARAPYSAASRKAWQRRNWARKGAGFSGLLSSATSARAAASRTSTLRSAVARIAGVRSPS